MKIGILTSSRTDNNGTDLQAVAMQNVFRRLGANDVEIIDYISEKIDTKAPIKLSIRNLLFLPLILFNRYTHRKFRKQNLNKSKKVYDKHNIDSAPYDIIVVGSDQVWNLELTGGDISYFLPFQKKGLRKYSYAVSLGTAKTEKWNEIYHIKDYLHDFDDIFVREKSGIDALRKINVDAHLSLDPILMGTKEDWASFTTPIKKKKYILIYLVRYDPMAVEYAQKIAKKSGLEIIMLNPGIKRWRGVTPHAFVSVERWLNLMANADMVITNSYHGFSFAILFRRNFRLCLLPAASKNNDRMIDLANNLRLTDYILKDINDSFEPINWERTEKLLMHIVQESEKSIKSIIGGTICH